MPAPITGFLDSVISRFARIQKVGPGAGFATLGSGVAAVTISHGLVKSGDLITLTCYPASHGAIASNQGYIGITSINPGVGFVARTITGVAYPWDTGLHWILRRTS